MLPGTADSFAPAIADDLPPIPEGFQLEPPTGRADMAAEPDPSITGPRVPDTIDVGAGRPTPLLDPISERSEEHTSELQSLMRISYAVFCLKKKNIITIAT